MDPSVCCVCQTECLLENNSHVRQNVEDLAQINIYVSISLSE